MPNLNFLDHVVPANGLCAVQAPISHGGYPSIGISGGTITIGGNGISYSISGGGVGYATEEADEVEDELSTSPELPESRMLGRCALTDKEFVLMLKPENNISAPDALKLMMLVSAYESVGYTEFSPYEYVKANNLERHFVIRDANEEM